MASWSAKRQSAIAFVSFLFIILILGVPSYLYFNKQPSCSDGKQNGAETGKDCGGSCSRLCSSELLAPLVLWQRMSLVAPGYYNVLAYIENPNAKAFAPNIPYVFKLYDSENVLIAERRGTTFLLPAESAPIYESALPAGARVPARVLFDLGSADEWQNPVSLSRPVLSVESKSLTYEEGKPRLDVVVKNTSIKTAENIDVVAVIFNGEGNAMAFSKTLIDRLSKGEAKAVRFTWRESFSGEVSKIEVYPRVPLKVE